MPPIITVDVMIWFTHNGKEQFSTFEKQMFKADADWVAKGYAEVNEGLCKIFHNDVKIAEHKF